MKDETRRFARRMASVASVVGVVVAVAPPVVYHAVGLRRLGEQAQVHADHVATRLRAAAARQPRLWQYNAGKAVQAAGPLADQPEVAGVRITDCLGESLRTLGRPGTGPTGWSPVEGPGGTVGWVQVRMDPSSHHRSVLLLAAASALLALLLSALSYLLPMGVVRSQAARIAGGRVVVRAQEQERQRIARDLHDGLGQQLTALRLGLEAALAHPGEAGVRLSQGLQTCDDTLDELRRVVQDLRPADLESSTLAEALRASGERFEVRTGVGVSVRTTLDVDPPEDVAVCLVRVLQEALANAARHGGAGEIGVTLSPDDGGVCLAIVDDGGGFDPADSTDGSGLAGIKERCGFLGGTVEVESSDGTGTRLTVRLPIG